MALSAIIFDVDGTLIDSNASHLKAWEISLKKHGYEVLPEPDLPLIRVRKRQARATDIGAGPRSGRRSWMPQKSKSQLPRSVFF